nr:hypothetical protein Iba_chr03bCG17360 [Ipomoea batatas]GMC75907.1 hypothetical protein Iba_chr03dCG9350 [Ipomoea batatas]GMC77388.1 hypothetical protein Iba_chr03eCG10210 [Ipomoea batatas]GMD75922.1 hypothetical protein Iba_scaffold310557CG0010 [Ipomoea batatas]
MVGRIPNSTPLQNQQLQQIPMQETPSTSFDWGIVEMLHARLDLQPRTFPVKSSHFTIHSQKKQNSYTHPEFT